MRVNPDKDLQKECEARIFEWLHWCWELRNRGEPMAPDPFYARNSVLTEDVCKSVLGGIAYLMEQEFKKFPAYHYPAQHVNREERTLVPPSYDRMTYQEQLAIVQGIDRIAQEYRVEDEPVVPPNLEGPPYVSVEEYL